MYTYITPLDIKKKTGLLLTRWRLGAGACCFRSALSLCGVSCKI